MKDPIKLLIVDDSKLLRRAIRNIFEPVENIQIVGEAANGKEALEMIPALKPDVITLDINMPVMDGVTTLKHIMIKHPTPVVMCSTLTEEGAVAAFDTLKFGAVDFIHKPSNLDTESLEAQYEVIRKKVIQAANVEIGAIRYLKSIPQNKTSGQGRSYNVVCGVGAAEGGSSALLKMIPLLQPELPAVFIVMLYESPQNVDSFSRYLNDNSPFKVERAMDALPLETGVCYIASGEESVMVQSLYGEYLKIAPASSPQKGVNELLCSIADVMKHKAAGVILSGTGSDGVDGVNAILKANGTVIVQDPKTCLFKEMPSIVIRECGAVTVIPDVKIAEEINKRFKG